MIDLYDDKQSLFPVSQWESSVFSVCGIKLRLLIKVFPLIISWAPTSLRSSSGLLFIRPTVNEWTGTKTQQSCCCQSQSSIEARPSPTLCLWTHCWSLRFGLISSCCKGQKMDSSVLDCWWDKTSSLKVLGGRLLDSTSLWWTVLATLAAPL